MNFLSISGIVFWVLLVLFITLRIIYGKNWAAKAGTSVFIGKGLIMSIKNLIRETRERNIKDETVAEVGAHVIWRVTRIGLIGLLIALAPITILLQQNKLLSIQNKQIESQNKLFSKQNEKIDVQNKSISIQNNLIEAGRRSSLVFLMNNILDKVDDEIKAQKDKKGGYVLSQSLIGRITALTKGFKPYYQLEKDGSLSEKYLSPERGHLLIALVNSDLSDQTLNQIYQYSIFSNADLTNVFLMEKYLSGANLENSDFSNAVLVGVNLIEANLNKANLSKAVLQGANLSNTLLVKADLTKANLFGATLQGANLSKANLKMASVHGANFAHSNLSSANLSGTILVETRLTKANLSNAILTKAILEKDSRFSSKFKAHTPLVDACSLQNCKGLSEKLKIRLHTEKPCLFSPKNCCLQY